MNAWREVLRVVTVVMGKWKLWLVGTGLLCGSSNMFVYTAYLAFRVTQERSLWAACELLRSCD